jgi:prepilin-type N-terminal cleavage/methylation domain-containing protein
MSPHYRGFTLLECLLASSLMVAVLAAALEISQASKKLFSRLKESQELNHEIWAGQDRIRRDLNRAGYGLQECLLLGLLSGVQNEASGLAIFAKEASFSLSADLEPGSFIVPLPSSDLVSRGQIVAFVSEGKGEIALVERVEKNRLILNKPLQNTYYKSSGQIIIVEKILYYLDQASQVLRRKVNSSPAQPLIEQVIAFNWLIEPPGLVKVSLTFDDEKETVHEIKVATKNILLAQQFWP